MENCVYWVQEEVTVDLTQGVHERESLAELKGYAGQDRSAVCKEGSPGRSHWSLPNGKALGKPVLSEFSFYFFPTPHTGQLGMFCWMEFLMFSVTYFLSKLSRRMALFLCVSHWSSLSFMAADFKKLDDIRK